MSKEILVKNNGYFSIENEIAEALAKTNLSCYENRILWTIIRKTIGWRKVKDGISYSQFHKMTNLDIRHINRTIKSLIAKNIIFKENKKSLSSVYEFNKDFKTWKGWILPIQATPKEAIPKKVIPKKATPKRIVLTQTEKEKIADFSNQLIKLGYIQSDILKIISIYLCQSTKPEFVIYILGECIKYHPKNIWAYIKTINRRLKLDIQHLEFKKPNRRKPVALKEVLEMRK